MINLNDRKVVDSKEFIRLKKSILHNRDRVVSIIKTIPSIDSDSSFISEKYYEYDVLYKKLLQYYIDIREKKLHTKFTWRQRKYQIKLNDILKSRDELLELKQEYIDLIHKYKLDTISEESLFINHSILNLVMLYRSLITRYNIHKFSKLQPKSVDIKKAS